MTRLTPGEEKRLYDTDRKAWVDYAAPRMIAELRARNDLDLSIVWGSMERATQEHLWPKLPEALKRRIRALRSAA